MCGLKIKLNHVGGSWIEELPVHGYNTPSTSNKDQFGVIFICLCMDQTKFFC